MAILVPGRSLLNLIAPVFCAGCNRPDVALCARCVQFLTGPAKQVRPAIGRALFGVPVLSGGVYLGVRRSVVLEMKERGRWKLATALVTESLINQVRIVVVQNPQAIIVPIPSSARGRLRRGFAPTVLFATALAQSVPGVSIGRCVHLVGGKEIGPLVGQHRLPGRSRTQRLQRGSSSYSVRGLPMASRVIVVDDVMATGGTLEAVASALQQKGHQVVLALVAAHVPLRVKALIPSIANRGYPEGNTLTRRT
jgi:predicted amidophosphoribosyltransferase